MPSHSFGKTFSAQPLGSGAELVTVEADVTHGLHSFSIVGLPDKAVEEARDRMGAAIRHSGLPSPKSQNHKITLSLSPADLKKEGSHYDLPLTIAYLRATDIVKKNCEAIVLGELSLDGAVRGVRGILPSLLAARHAGIQEAFVPKDNEREAVLMKNMRVYPVSSLREIVEHLQEHSSLSALEPRIHTYTTREAVVDLSHIKGQETAKRALEIAATGRHNIVFYGPPGTGKTMLARALPGILPALTEEESLEVASIHSTAGTLQKISLFEPPFRSPHHSTSHVALVGGGAFPKAGEVTLSHRGVLFLDEFPEFEKRSIEALRQPLEDRVVTISRARGTMTFPADFLLVAAMNPDQTLYSGGATIPRHTKKISLPIVDRVDLWVEVPLIPHRELTTLKDSEKSEDVRSRVSTARERAYVRYGNGEANGRMTASPTTLQFSDEAINTLISASEKLALSPRAFHRVLRVSRTIADLEGSVPVLAPHILEALNYRPRNLF